MRILSSRADLSRIFSKIKFVSCAVMLCSVHFIDIDEIPTKYQNL